MDVEAEIDDLKRRVNDLEGAVNVLSGQVGKLHPELLAVKLQSSEGFNRVEAAVSRVIGRLDTMNTQVWSLRDDLPAVIEETMAKVDRSGKDDRRS
jgi:AICAR transformylase/IMP cyclohydrolase PurH